MTDRDLKVRWFDRGVEALNVILTPELGDFYVCPLCREPFSREQMESTISFEHAPPESVGGARVALTCRPCNNTAGTLLDARLSRDEITRAFLAGGGLAPGTVTVAREGVDVRGELSIESGAFSFNAISTQNDPELLERFRASAQVWADHAHGGREMAIRIPVHFNSRRAHLGWLRAAYVAAFACFGYRYALQPAFEILLEQFRRPDELLIEPLPLGEDANLAQDTRRIAFVTEPAVMRCVMVTIGRFTAYLPAERDDTFFQEFVARMNAAYELVGESTGPTPTLVVEMADYPWPTEPLYLWDGPRS